MAAAAGKSEMIIKQNTIKYKIDNNYGNNCSQLQNLERDIHQKIQ
jgi:hypothetical protein